MHAYVHKKEIAGLSSVFGNAGKSRYECIRVCSGCKRSEFSTGCVANRNPQNGYSNICKRLHFFPQPRNVSMCTCILIFSRPPTLCTSWHTHRVQFSCAYDISVAQEMSHAPVCIHLFTWHLYAYTCLRLCTTLCTHAGAVMWACLISCIQPYQDTCHMQCGYTITNMIFTRKMLRARILRFIQPLVNFPTRTYRHAYFHVHTSTLWGQTASSLRAIRCSSLGPLPACVHDIWIVGSFMSASRRTQAHTCMHVCYYVRTHVHHKYMCWNAPMYNDARALARTHASKHTTPIHTQPHVRHQFGPSHTDTCTCTPSVWALSHRHMYMYAISLGPLTQPHVHVRHQFGPSQTFSEYSISSYTPEAVCMHHVCATCRENEACTIEAWRAFCTWLETRMNSCCGHIRIKPMKDCQSMCRFTWSKQAGRHIWFYYTSKQSAPSQMTSHDSNALRHWWHLTQHGAPAMCVCVCSV
jgi:hypothetical protein